MLSGNENNDTSTKKKTSRCPCCKRKMTVEFKCYCNTNFCISCRLPEWHKCEVDFKLKGKEEINKNNPKVTAEKLCKV